MATLKGSGLGITSLIVYVVGGIATFSGLAMIAFMNGRDFFGVGDGRSIGYLFLCVGLCLSILGVLMMRMFRNRWRR